PRRCVFFSTNWTIARVRWTGEPLFACCFHDGMSCAIRRFVDRPAQSGYEDGQRDNQMNRQSRGIDGRKRETDTHGKSRAKNAQSSE
ncbi:MAG TPA: hypothetical protein PLJ27_09055, partial [Polyangiaceae bacterium]|nr:hypothetical protein [Polyangiaceae bacterium]